MNEKTFQGGCLCGAVRFDAHGLPGRVLHCHCKSCRGHTGAAVATLAVSKASQVNFSGNDRKIHSSTPGVGRAFCDTCGSSLTWETVFREEGELCAIHISTFDDPEMLEPNAHSFYPERISWFEVDDKLPRHESFVADSEPLCFGPAS